MQRVLHIFASLDRGGAETRVLELYRELDRAALQFDFAVLRPGPHSYDAEVSRLGGRRFEMRHPREHGLIANFVDLVTVMRRERFLAVHAHTAHYSGVALLAARLAGIGHRVAHARTTSTSHAGNPLKRAAVALGRALILTNATCLLAISEEAARYVFGGWAVRSGRAVVVPNAIALTPYAELSDDDSLLLRRALGIPAQALVLGNVGRFSFMKNQHFLLRVLDALRGAGTEAWLVLVGDGEMRHSVEEAARAQGVDGNVRFLGVRTDVPRLNRMFDVHAMPSLFEGLGGAAIEAQAAGTPCVLSTGMPRAVDMGLGITEFLPVDDPARWAEAVLRRAGQQRPRFETVREAFERRGFTIERETSQFLEAYGLAWGRPAAAESAAR